MDIYIKVVTSIPGIDIHDANAVTIYFAASFFALQFPF